MEQSFDTSLRVVTIGHSNHSAAHFLKLLSTNDIQVVVDTRSQPYSKYATQFDQNDLKDMLAAAGCSSGGC